MTAEPDTEWLEAGRVGRPHGLDGSFYVTRPRPELIQAADELGVGEDGVTEVVRRAGTADKPILRLARAADREAIEALRGSVLRVPRAVAPPLDVEEWYATDLVGCVVADGVTGTAVGTVAELLGLPSCEALVVPRDGRADLLVPLVKDCVRAVDLEARTIDIDLAFLGEDAA